MSSANSNATERTIYYAHPVSLYGTPQQDRDLVALAAIGRVVNPDTPEKQALYKERGMDAFLEIVDGCDMLAFRAFLDGSISAGVRKEIDRARERGLLIIELPSNIDRRTLTVEQTRAALSECGSR